MKIPETCSTNENAFSKSDDLPEGWKIAYLGEVCTPPQYGWTTSSERNASGLKIVRTSDISSGEIDWSTVPVCKEEPENIDKFLLKQGDILISRAGSVGTSFIIKDCPRAVFASYLIRFRALPSIETNYLGLFLKSRLYWDSIAGETIGITIPNVNASKLKQIPIPLPPLAEQQRIVARVEALLSHVDAAGDRLSRVPAIMKRFRQSVLAAACSGRLTEEWREENLDIESGRQLPERIAELNSSSTVPDEDDPPLSLPEIPDNWIWSRCFCLCDPKRDITYGVIKLGAPIIGGIPTLRSSDVRWLFIDNNNVKTIDPDIASQYSRTFLKGGEIVITVRGSLGGIAVVPQSMAGYNISREVAVLPLPSDLDAKYFSYAIASIWSQNWLSEVTKGVAYTGINIRDLKRLPLPVPPLAEQQEIVRRVGLLFERADAIEREVAAAGRRCERLTQAVMVKAFSGRL